MYAIRSYYVIPGASPLLRNALDLGDVVAEGLDHAQQHLVVLLGDIGLARHDPYEVALLAADDRLRIVVIEIDDPVIGLDRPDEAHPPEGVRPGIADEALRVVLLLLAIETAVAERERRRDRASYNFV